MGAAASGLSVPSVSSWPPCHAELCLVSRDCVSIGMLSQAGMLFLPDDGFESELQLGDEFLADSLFEPDDCVLTDVNLSDALTDRREGHSMSGSLHSDGDSCPNSPGTELEDSPHLSVAGPTTTTPGQLPEDQEQTQVRVKLEPGMVIKQEPGYYGGAQQSVLRQPAIVFRPRLAQGRLLCPKLMVVKSEPKEEESKPVIKPAAAAKTQSRRILESCLLSSNKLSNGELSLTEEEKRTLLSEGYPVPARLPLSKAEERSLKKIRRKIKNKISAQESRRKKKEYLDKLEMRCERVEEEKDKWEARCLELEQSNRALHKQLAELQSRLSVGRRGSHGLDIDVD